MNDLINNNTKQKNIIVLFDMFKQIIEKLSYHSQSKEGKKDLLYSIVQEYKNKVRPIFYLYSDI